MCWKAIEYGMKETKERGCHKGEKALAKPQRHEVKEEVVELGNNPSCYKYSTNLV